jgi:hypothetical protein
MPGPARSGRCVPPGQQMCPNGQLCPSTSTCCGGSCCDTGSVRASGIRPGRWVGRCRHSFPQTTRSLHRRGGRAAVLQPPGSHPRKQATARCWLGSLPRPRAGVPQQQHVLPTRRGRVRQQLLPSWLLLQQHVQHVLPGVCVGLRRAGAATKAFSRARALLPTRVCSPLPPNPGVVGPPVWFGAGRRLEARKRLEQRAGHLERRAVGEGRQVTGATCRRRRRN